MAQCPHCMTDIHDKASVCPSCGAKKGIYGPGWTTDDYLDRAKVIAALAGFFLLIGVGFLIAGRVGVFVLMAIVALFVGSLAIVTLVMSGGKEKWYRPLILEDLRGAVRPMRALVQPFTAPYWYDAPEGQPNQADLECAGDMLDLFIDALDESLPGIYRDMVPADEEVDWSTPRGISTGRSGPMFLLSVLPGGGYRLAAQHGDQHFSEDNLSFEAMAMLVRVLLKMWGNDG